MSDMQDFKKNLRDMAKASAQYADEILAEELQTLLIATRPQLEALRPRITDKETYDKLIAAVEEATLKEDQAGQLKETLLKGGSGLFNVGKIAASLLKGL